ncbi:MAG TPA: mercuric reductase [Nitrospiria bacterium]
MKHQNRFPVLPENEHNRTLVNNVHPPDWINPEPAGRYNLVVIGAGTAGLISAVIGASLGAKVALIERHLMGGDCLNVGCVPSKGLIRASRVWAEVKNSPEFGVKLKKDGLTFDFGTALDRMYKTRAQISHNDSAQRYTELGVDVFIGGGSFTGPDTIEVEGKALKFARAAICTGGRAAGLPIPGLEEAGYLTNETVFELVALPRRLAVIGAGPIGCELAQAFARFGSEVTVFEQECRVLPREDPEAAEIVDRALARDGVRFICDASVKEVKKQGAEKVIRYTRPSGGNEVGVDEILVAIGRKPNVEGLNLEKAGVSFDRKGVTVNSRLQTSNSRIYAAGDIAFPFKFTHTAEATAQVLVQNALFPHPFGLGYASTDSLIIPWCTYTEPEIAHVGMYEADAKAKGLEVDTFRFNLDEIDRAILDGKTEGFAKVHVKTGTDPSRGATIVADHAGDLISEFTVARTGGLGLGTLGGTIHPYPTQAEVIKRVANAWRKTTLTEGKKKFLKKLFSWMR